MNEFSSVVVSKWANSSLRNLPAVRERANGCVSALSEHCEYEQIAMHIWVWASAGLHGRVYMS